MIDELQAQPVGEEPREYLEALRVLLKSQVTTYLSYVTGRRDALSSTTSTMYAGELSPAGPVPVTLRGLIEGGTLSKAQAARLASCVLERRTLLIFGDRSTGKSTLLNALLDLMPVDERVVAIEHGDHLPALEERSFCTRLTVEDGVDVAGIFARAVKMQPSRIIVGEIHADEMLHFLTELSRRPEAGGFCTVRADSVHMAVAKLLRQMELSVAAPRPGSWSGRCARCSPTCAATSAANRAWPRSGRSKGSIPMVRSCSTRCRPTRRSPRSPVVRAVSAARTAPTSTRRRPKVTAPHAAATLRLSPAGCIV